ncbi:MarR family transcriptional regulator [Streptomyces sp. LP05-1]|uniref:MarR family transcriptional regulator n=1 Tax=Streptomyces pyxinae TaxID=2970734 RepID=A0ABT2CK81_9ACTN|nr:MarR family transcriptional regulator [Streptomyces sp. LP05-1]MCS0637710.1 MarR family transcriptional regulator [Streptomyces sp. LP05-1]
MTRTPTTLTPADPAAPDTALATQPVGYWTGVAHRAVVNHLRDAMARQDVTQPQWWILNRVDAPGPPPTRQVVAAGLAAVADGPHEVPRALDQLLRRGWLTEDPDGRLGLTAAGRAARARIKSLVTGLRDGVHEGVSDEDYVTTLRVLRRMIANVAALTAAEPRDGSAVAAEAREM